MVTTTTAPSLDEYKSFHGMLCRPKTAKRCIEIFNNGVALFADQKEYEYDDDDINHLNHLSNFDFNNNTAELGSGLPFNIWTYYLLVVLSLTGLCSLLRITQCLKAVEYNLNFDDNNEQASVRLVFRKGGDDRYIESTEIKNEKNKLRIPQNAIDYVINRSISLGPLIDTTTTKKKSSPFSSSSLSEQHKRKQSTNDNDNGNGSGNSNSNDDQTSIQLIRCFEYDFGWGALSVMSKLRYVALHYVSIIWV